LITDGEAELAADRISREKRSELMKRIRSKDTSPELTVRKLVFSLGYRYRLHGKNLPGKPDLVFPGRRKVIFVNGCFWHCHNCKEGRLPKSNLDYWLPKLQRNRCRDEYNQQLLVSSGWRFLVIWQCQMRDLATLKKNIVAFLEEDDNDFSGIF
jgi:DNA mismatch endonuclease (patch repair protein)